MTTTPKRRCTCAAGRVVRALRQEVDRSITLVEHDRVLDERARGQLEALRHVQTVIANQTGRRRR